MCEPVVVTLLKMQPYYSQPSQENATAPSSTSPKASYKEVPPGCSLDPLQKSRRNQHSYVRTDRSSIWDGPRTGAKAVRYSVNTT